MTALSLARANITVKRRPLPLTEASSPPAALMLAVMASILVTGTLARNAGPNHASEAFAEEKSRVSACSGVGAGVEGGEAEGEGAGRAAGGGGADTGATTGGGVAQAEMATTRASDAERWIMGHGSASSRATSRLRSRSRSRSRHLATSAARR